MSYPDSVRYLYSIGNELKTAKLGLERIQALLRALGQPQERCRFVHVAGTNGKGSTSAMVEAGLRHVGIRTGLYTSPHLIEPTERIQVAGHPVTPAQFDAAFQRVHAVATTMLAAGELDLHPTYFETVTAMAFLLFRDLQAETVVLEVGLGGRLDATNVVQPDVCVLTPIDYDHQDFLGNSIESIASEKAGILKPHVPVVVSRQRRDALRVIRSRAGELSAPLVETEDWRIDDLEYDAGGHRYRAAGPGASVQVSCPLAGLHQVVNSLTAAVTLHTLGQPARGIAGTRWPGRLERLAGPPECLLDGAHNPAGARALARHLQRFYPHRRITLVFAAMRDKSVEEMLSPLLPLASSILLTRPDTPRALEVDALRVFARHSSVRAARDVPSAVAMLRGGPPDDLVVVTGSLFLVGEWRAAFPAHPLQ